MSFFTYRDNYTIHATLLSINQYVLVNRADIYVDLVIRYSRCRSDTDIS